jgi:manganese transport protein
MSKLPLFRASQSLPEIFGSVKVARNGSFWKKLGAFTGPGLMVAVGYMDPGNWATDIAGGAKFGYTLLSVILLSNLCAMILQHLSLKLGIATQQDLAQACRNTYSKPISFTLWLLAEIAIAATDLAEVLGSALALHLLFDIPITVGVLITVVDVLVLMALQGRGFRRLEALVGGLVFMILACFGYQVIISHPQWQAVAVGLVPTTDIVTNADMLYIAIGILGATVMPHNLYLHSGIVQTRNIGKSDSDKQEAIRFATIDSTLSLSVAFFINAAILIVAAATFHANEMYHIADITQAHHLLDPTLGSQFAGKAFAIALLAAGQNATLTGTLAGQIVMEGFLQIQLKPWLSRLVTRLIAVIPAFFITLIYGEASTGNLLVLSQVVLSLQLSFAIFPLVMFTSDAQKMGVFVNAQWLKYLSWAIALLIAGLNIYLLFNFF